MAILNMTYGAGNPYQPFHLNGISDLAILGGDSEATITWTDPGDLIVDGQTLATWSSTKLVRKTGSAPTTSSDGTLVVTETVADTYSVSGYTDTGLTNGTTYYYGAFAVADNGLETISNTESVTPAQSGWQPGVNTLLYYSLNGNANDLSGNGYNGTRSNGGHYATGIGGEQCGDFSRGNNEFLSCTTFTTIPSTVMFFMKWHDLNATTQDWRQIIGQTSDWYNSGWCLRAQPTRYNSSNLFGNWCKGSPFQEFTDTSVVDLDWHHFVLTTDGTSTYFYVDGNLIHTYSGSLPSDSFLKIGKVSSGSSEYDANAYLQHIIFESVQRSQQDIQNYLSNFSY